MPDRTDPAGHLEVNDVLQQSEAMFRLVFEQSSVGMVMVSLDRRFLRCNEAFLRFVGHNQEELVGTDFLDITWHEDRLIGLAEMREIISGNLDRYQAQKRYVRKDGHVVWADVLIALIRDAQGRPLFFLPVIQDITERRLADAALRETQQRLALATTAAHIGIWDWDVVNNRMLWDERMYRLYGVDPTTTATGVEIWQNGLHPDDAAATWETCQAALRGELPWDTEFRIVIPDGTVRHIKANGVVLRDADGNPVRMLGTNYDITMAKQAEAALRDSENRLSTLFNSAAFGIVVVDKDFRFVQTNQTFLDMFGYNAEEVQALSPADITHPGDPVFTLDMVRTEREAGNISGVKVKRYRRKDKRTFWANSAVVPFGQDGMVIGVVIDIDAQKQAEERLRQAEKMQALGQLAGGVAHDFNNQLAGILGYAELLVERLDDPGLRTFASHIQTAAHRSADLTRQLLAFSRKGMYVSIPVDVHMIITEVVALLERSLDKRVSIVQHLAAEPHLVLGDPTQLQNAFLNLAVNARDAMPDGGLLTFTTTVVELPADPTDPDMCTGRHIQIGVSDTGQGMDAQTMKRLFEPFFTTKEQGRGTGLGLAAVHGAVKNHHGKIRVESQLQCGSTFTVLLPVLERSEGMLAETAAAMAPGQTASILVVDDEAVLRQVTCDLLRGCGYHVTACADGESALAFFQRSSAEIDLVLLDMVMPRMSGGEVFTAMRRIDPRVKALLMSGHSVEGEAQQTLNAGMLGFIQKPFTLKALLHKVAETLGREQVRPA